MSGVNLGLFFILSIATCQSSPALLLTPLITTNRVQEARNLSIVDPSYFLNVTSHSGFLTVDERYNSNTFFWYFPVAGKPVNETPWIVWLQGGPGASSIAGLFDEIGPFQYVDNKLKLREHTWAMDHSMLFIDNPVGAGYSFTNSDEGFVKDMPMCASHLYKALRQFLIIFPELRKAPLYIAGESYAGRYLPALGLKILEQDSTIGALDVDLKGIIMGNPVLNRDIIADYSTIFYQWGLIDTQGVLAVKPLQDSYTKAIQYNDDAAFDLRNKLLDRLGEVSMQMQTYNLLEDNLDNNLMGFMQYIDQPEVRQAIKVGSITFTFSNSTVHRNLKADFLSEVTWKLEKLLDHYQILIYCGQLDMTAPCVPNAQARRKNWFWSQRDDFLKSPRTPWWYNNSVAGYVKSGGRFTEVLVRGAGHLVPMDKPAQVLQLVSYFIRGLDMPYPPNYQIKDEDTPDYDIDTTAPSSGTKTAMIVSILTNVILVLGIVAGVVYCLRWKRRTEAFLYNTVDETSISEGVLTMT